MLKYGAYAFRSFPSSTQRMSVLVAKLCRKKSKRLDFFRHTFASICYAAKMDVKTTQKLMGHAKISTTMDIYTHLDEMFLEDDITKFNEYILKGK